MIARFFRALVRVVAVPVGIAWGLVLVLGVVFARLVKRVSDRGVRRRARRAHRALARELAIDVEAMTGSLRFEAYVWDRSGRPEIDDVTRSGLLALLGDEVLEDGSEGRENATSKARTLKETDG